MLHTIFQIDYSIPIIFTAIHSGHQLSDICSKNMKLPENLRLMEEDPYTDIFAKIHDNYIIPPYSRFEVDLNRSRTSALYRKPEDCWGLDSRIKEPNEEQINFAYKIYDDFYSETKKHLDILSKKHKKFIVLDLHSYNHNRLGNGKEFDDPEKNPEIIIGTNNMPAKWKPFIKDFHNHILSFDYFGRQIDARIDVKYPGGNFSRWIHNNYPENGIAIALEYKKIFMNEWTNELYEKEFLQLQKLTEFMRTFLLETIKK